MEPIGTAKLARQALDAGILNDLKSKQALIEAACRCLENERSYRFFGHLVSLSQLEGAEQERVMNRLESSGEYEGFEMNAIRRLVTSGGARAFKDLVDLVRDIRVDQEIESMLQ